MKRTDDLMIKTGTIAELCGLIRDAKTDYNKSIDALNRDTTYKDEYKKELANRYKTSLDAKILEYEAGIKRGIEEIKASVFEPMNKEDMADIMQTIDYISTMKSAGALSDNIVSVFQNITFFFSCFKTSVANFILHHSSYNKFIDLIQRGYRLIFYDAGIG